MSNYGNGFKAAAFFNYLVCFIISIIYLAQVMDDVDERFRDDYMETHPETVLYPIFVINAFGAIGSYVLFSIGDRRSNTERILQRMDEINPNQRRSPDEVSGTAPAQNGAAPGAPVQSGVAPAAPAPPAQTLSYTCEFCKRSVPQVKYGRLVAPDGKSCLCNVCPDCWACYGFREP